MSKKILMISLAIIIVVVVCEPTHWFVNNREKFLDGILTTNLLALTSLYLSKAGLEVLAGTDFNLVVATVKAGKVFSPLLDVMDKGINFLTFTSAILACMKVALSLFTSILFKGVLVGALVASLWSKVRKSALSVAIFLIMLNPGLPLYLLLAEGAAHVMEGNDPSNADKLKEVATAAKEKFDSYSETFNKQLKEDLQKKEKKEIEQLEKENIDGKNEKSLIQKISGSASDAYEGASNAISEAVTNAVEKVKNYFNLILNGWGNWTTKLADDVSKKATEMTDIIVNMLAKAIILYVLMPLGYYYFLRLALRPLIESVNSDFNTRIPQLPKVGEAINRVGELRKPGSPGH
jgi:hypothetical protein